MVVFSSLKIDIPKKKMCCKAAKTKKVKEQKQTKNKQKNTKKNITKWILYLDLVYQLIHVIGFINKV